MTTSENRELCLGLGQEREPRWANELRSSARAPVTHNAERPPDAIAYVIIKPTHILEITSRIL
jgi:hypothetical protein